MWRTLLFARFLGEFAVPSHAIHYGRFLEASQDLHVIETKGTFERTFDTFAHGGMFGNALFNFDAITEMAAGGFEPPKLSLMDTGLEVDGERSEEAAGDLHMSGTTLSPKQRAEAHAKKYTAEFVVELNMTKAHETGQSIGLVTDVEAEFIPASVWKIHKTGLLEEWNKANRAAGKDVHVGDEIVQVNNILWHANTNAFIKRIAGQFKAARSLKEGTSDVLRLYIQRPKAYADVWQSKRFQAQRDDAHTQEYSKEFVAELPMPYDIRNVTLDSIMGWKINTTDEWKPATIGRIADEGSVATWNKEHPDELILEGDEFMKIDNILNFASSHKVSVFMRRLEQHYKNAQSVEATNRSLLVRIQRPRAVQAAFDEKHPVEEIISTNRVPYEVTLQFQDTEAEPLGLKTSPGVDADDGWSGPVLVWQVLQEGPAGRWNEANPGRSIAPFDEIAGVNGASWEDYDTAKEFADKVRSTLASANSTGVPVSLSMVRPIESVSYIRHNMESGVHMDCVGCTSTTTEPPPFLLQDDGPTAGPATSDRKSGGTEKDDDVIGASED